MNQHYYINGQSITVKDIDLEEAGDAHHDHGEAQPSIKKMILGKVENVLRICQFAKGPQLDCDDETNLKVYEPEHD